MKSEKCPQLAIDASKISTSKDSPIATLLGYELEHGEGDAQTIDITCAAQIRDFSEPSQKVVGILCCEQKVESLADAAHALMDEDRDFLGYIGFLASQFIGIHDMENRASILTTVIGHEVVKPFSNIIESVQMLDGYKRRGNEIRYQEIYDELMDLFDFVIDYTFDIARFGTEPKLAYKESIHFRDRLLVPLMNALRDYAKRERNIGFVCRGTFPSNYSMDKRAMRAALYNVMSNAIKYSRENGRAIEVIGVEERLKKWKIIVRDWGIGIPEEEVEMVFQKFGCCGNAKAHDNTGLGLGLYMAQRIIYLHCGTIRITSIANPTEFTIDLPY